jgi:uncharacterized protein (DUF305 family)
MNNSNKSSTNSKIITTIAGIIVLIGGIYFVSIQTAKSKTEAKQTAKSGDSSMMGMDHSSMNMDGYMKMSMNEIKDDKSFLFEMIPHHQEAVDSSQTILKSTKDIDIKTFAEKVIVDQNKEIADMKTWYKDISSKEYTVNATYRSMMTGMNSKTGADLDKEYISGMVAHHQMAITMSNSVLKIAKDARVKTIAYNIIKNQQSEIKVLSEWLSTKFGDQEMMMGM